MTVDLKHCKIIVNGNRCDTVFPDGKVCTGITGLGNPDQEHSAVQMGYPVTEKGLNNMLRDHEILHHLICMHLGFPTSIVHRLISYFGQNVPEEFMAICKAEENLVGAFQSWMNTGKVSSELNDIKDPIYLQNEFHILLAKSK